ncbi:hypothetical protein GCM10009854_20790 [Saccharopolyspora halophila]|uniref:Uncharacterized protein n=1 Tax=Saccharopolyspora halophila TaxID=405551 RepID=A0ABN3G4G9_9PSEU
MSLSSNRSKIGRALPGNIPHRNSDVANDTNREKERGKASKRTEPLPKPPGAHHRRARRGAVDQWKAPSRRALGPRSNPSAASFPGRTRVSLSEQDVSRARSRARAVRAR